MLKRYSDTRWEDCVNHKGGKGTCRVLNVLEADEMHGLGRCYGICVIPVGASIGKHQHVGDFETYYILEGQARYLNNTEWVEIGPGDTVHCADGEYHSIENIGTCDLKYFTSILFSPKK